MNKCILVTGANGGMGKSVCKKLSDAGFSVFALDLTDAPIQNNIIPIKADICDTNSLLTAKNTILQHCDKLFAIIHLAGFFAMDSIVLGDREKLEKSFSVNFWGVYLTNKVFFDMLQQDSRIIVMSSEVARYSPHPFDGFYAIPKTTLDKYCDCLRRECRFLGIKIIKIQAGSFNTDMTKKAATEFEKLKATAKPFEKVLTAFDKFVGKEIGRGSDTQIIANVVQKIISTKKPKICYRIKNSFKLKFINSLPEKTQDDLYPFAVKILTPKKSTKENNHCKK